MHRHWAGDFMAGYRMAGDFCPGAHLSGWTDVRVDRCPGNFVPPDIMPGVQKALDYVDT